MNMQYYIIMIYLLTNKVSLQQIKILGKTKFLKFFLNNI